MLQEGKRFLHNEKQSRGGGRVLHILSSLEDGGGIQSIIKNYYPRMVEKGYVFDFVVHGTQIGGMEEWFENTGSRIFHIPPRSKNFMRNVSCINRVIKTGGYEIVHCHQDYHSMLALMMAKYHSVKVRIVHSHLAYPPENALKKIIRIVESSLIKHLATNFIAVSRDAGIWLYGNSFMKKEKVSVIYNSIQTDKFKYNVAIRDRVRREFEIENDIIVGHVGRFSEQKNHSLLLKIFCEYHHHNRNSKLMLAGDGTLMEKTKSEAKELGIYNAVLFLGARTDVNNLFQAMDVLVFPSRYEGFGNVVIEAQAASLPVVCSSFVPHEVKETELVNFIPNDSYENIESWIQQINIAVKRPRSEGFENIIEKKHGVNATVEALSEIYKS